MGFDQVKAGKDVPNDINVIIEISAQGDPIKFEVDKDSGAIFVDRFMGTSMRYPINYGYVPEPLPIDDDLDFRRFTDAYARLDPATRPAYDQ